MNERLVDVDSLTVRFGIMRDGYGNYYGDQISLTQFACELYPLDGLEVNHPTFIELKRQLMHLGEDEELLELFNALAQDDLPLTAHCRRVGSTFEKGLAEIIDDTLGFEYIGWFHDVGKWLDPVILNITKQPRRLTSDEYAKVKGHVENSADLFEDKPLIWAVIAGHHEFGQKKPYKRGVIHADEDGLKLLIPLRVFLSACDKADAFLWPRPERGAGNPEDLANYLKGCGYSNDIIERIKKCASYP